MKDDRLKNENWDRFLPKFENKNPNKKKSKKQKKDLKKKKEYTPFPPPQPESKIDKMMASGEYFLSDKEKKAKLNKEHREKQAKNKAKQQEKRAKDYIPPVESNTNDSKKQKLDKIDVKALKSKIKKANKTQMK